MADPVLIVSKDGVRYGTATPRVPAAKPSPSDTKAADGRRIEDVIDLGAGLRAAEALRGANPADVAATLAEAGQQVRTNADKFGALLSGWKDSPFDRMWNAVRKVVTDILSGPHPAKAAPAERQTVSERMAAQLAPPLGDAPPPSTKG